MTGNKAAAYSSIKEVSKELDLPSHVLRFWETRFKDIKPVKRGGGCRYYRVEDVELIKRIKHLLYDEKYTIKGALSILKDEKSHPKDTLVAQVSPVPSAPSVPPVPASAKTSLHLDFLPKLKEIRDVLKSALD